MTSLDTSLVMIHSTFSVVTGYNFVKLICTRVDATLDFGLVKDKASVSEAVVPSVYDVLHTPLVRPQI